MAFASTSRPGSLRDILAPLPKAGFDSSDDDNPRHHDNAADQRVGYGTFGADSMNNNLWLWRWEHATARIAESATLPFLLMQLPQIILDAHNLLKHNYTALSAVQWKAQLTSLAGNLSLMSYFVYKKERGATIVQAVGVLTTLVVLIQLAIATTMPLYVLMITVISCLIGFVVSGLQYKSYLKEEVWRIWQEILGVVGIFVLCQIIWSTFDFLPSSIFPGAIAALIDVTLIFLARLDRLPTYILRMMAGVSGWTATLLFMWSPIAQLYTNFLNPSNIEGLSVYTELLAFIGNGFLMARALFIRDLMWFTGASCGCLVQGWAIIFSMYLYQATSGWIFWIVTCSSICWLGLILVMDQKAYSLRWPFSGLIELYLGTRDYMFLK